MVIIGVDPGLTGAICVIGPGWQEIIDIPTCDNGQDAGSMKRWVDVRELASLLGELRWKREMAADALPFVFIERPIAMPTLPAQTIASQFDTFGVLRAVLSRNGLIHIFNPRDWKRMYAVGADKEKARETAAALYPNLAPMLKRVKDHNRADSVLIAHYGLKEMA